MKGRVVVGRLKLKHHNGFFSARVADYQQAFLTAKIRALPGPIA
jgi:hypothetical protein